MAPRRSPSFSNSSSAWVSCVRVGLSHSRRSAAPARSPRLARRWRCERRWGCARRPGRARRTTRECAPRSITPSSRSAWASCVLGPNLLGQHARPLERLLGAVEIRLERRRRVSLAERRAEQVLAELQARAQARRRRRRRCAAFARARRATSAAARTAGRRAAPRRGAAERRTLPPCRRPPRRARSSSVIASSRSVTDPGASSASSRMHSSWTRWAGCETTPKRVLDDAQCLLGRVGSQRGARGVERVAGDQLGVARRKGVADDDGQAFGRSARRPPSAFRRSTRAVCVAGQATARRAQRRGPARARRRGACCPRSPASLIRPAAIAGLSSSNASRRLAGIVSPILRAERAQIVHAERAAQDGAGGQHLACFRRKRCGAATDQRAYRRWHEPIRVACQTPRAADGLKHSGLAIGARQLLDDERHALSLGVDRHGRGRAWLRHPGCY